MNALRAWARAARSLRRSPSYAVGTIIVLGVGIGIAAAAFSAVRGAWLEELPHRGEDRLVYLRQRAPGVGEENVLFSVPEIEDYRAGVSAIAELAEFSSMRFTTLGLDRPREVRAGVVTANFFAVMGLDAVVGRVLGTGDGGENADPVAVLTERMWRTVFGADPEVVGRAFTVNGRVVTIVGVAERHPPYPARTDLYVNLVTSPHHLGAIMNQDRTHRMTEVFGRLRPGTSLASARAEVRTVAARMRTEYAEAYEPGYGFDVRVRTLGDQLARPVRPVLAVLVATAALVLLLVVADAASLVLTRATRLRDELVVRGLLGATPGDLRMRLLRENLLLGVGAAAVGAAVSAVGARFLAEYLAQFSVRAAEVQVDLQALGLALLLGTGLAAALAFLPRLPLDADVRRVWSGARTTSDGSVRWTQRLLVGAQVALSVVLVSGAGLLARSLVDLRATVLGMDAERVLTMELPRVRNGRSPQQVRDDYLAMVEEVEAIPGVASAALTNSVPMTGFRRALPWTFAFELEGRFRTPDGPPFRADFRTVTPAFFETLGGRVVVGRGFRRGDDATAPPVAIVNESFVRRFLEEGDPLGRRLRWRDEATRFVGISDRWRTIVGVVSDVRSGGPQRSPSPAVYQPHRQEPFGSALLLRANGDPARFAGEAESAIRSVESDQPVEYVATLADIRAELLGGIRLNASLAAILAVVSLVLAAAGVYAVLAFTVGQRTRELGIRMAIGADAPRIVREVVIGGMGVVGAGVIAGLGASLGFSRLLGRVIEGLPPHDLGSMGIAVSILLLASLTATAVPALRASHVDPARVLRE